MGTVPSPPTLDDRLDNTVRTDEETARPPYQRLGYLWAFIPIGGVAVLGALLLLPLRKLDAQMLDDMHRAHTMASVTSSLVGATSTEMGGRSASARRTTLRAFSFLSAEGGVIGSFHQPQTLAMRTARAHTQPCPEYETPDGGREHALR